METSAIWKTSHPLDVRASQIYNEHYSRKVLRPASRGKRQITIANSLVLVTQDYSALWITTRPNPIARNDGKDLWLNQVFCLTDRGREQGLLASTLITEAVRVTRWHWQTQRGFDFIPSDGFISYIDEVNVRSKLTPGYCYRKASPAWDQLTERTSDKGLITYHLLADRLRQVEPLQALPWLPVGAEQSRMAM